MRAILIVFFASLAVAAFATPQPIMGPITTNGGPNPFSDKFIGSIGTLGSGGGGGGCTGTIDLSTGCVQPTLGAL